MPLELARANVAGARHQTGGTTMKQSLFRRSVSGRGALLAAQLMLLWAGRLHSDDHTVTNIADSGTGSLRDAIQAANATTGPDTIVFDLPVGSVICPERELPALSDSTGGTTLDGDMNGDGKPDVVIDGVLVTESIVGLRVSGSDNTIRGLVVRGFQWGIYVGNGVNNRVMANYFGTDVAGVLTAEGWASGFSVSVDALAVDTVIGGSNPGDGNVICGSTWSAVVLYAGAHASVAGNLIGVGADGSSPLGNEWGVEVRERATGIIVANVISASTRYGVYVAADAASVQLTGNTIGLTADGTTGAANADGGVWLNGSSDAVVGGLEEEQGNVISGNGGPGISVTNGATHVTVSANACHGNDGPGIAVTGETTQVTMSRNVCHGNDGPGIDLGSNGITLNDPDDSDSGPNGLLNFPVLTATVHGQGKRVRIEGVAGPDALVELFQSSAQPTRHGEAVAFLVAVPADAAGRFQAEMPAFEGTVTSTATDTEGNTSEFSVAIPAANVAPVCGPIAGKAVARGQWLRFTLTAADPNVPPDDLSFSLTTSPADASLEPTTGLFSWRPEPDYPLGEETLRVTCTDSGIPPKSSTVEFTITVLPGTAYRPDDRTLTAVPATALALADGTAGRLSGTYVDRSLRSYLVHDDWRVTQVLAGCRDDAQVYFTWDSWGTRREVGLTGGEDASWSNFSVQWDGEVTIATNGTCLYTWSGDGSRMWIDVDGNGHFSSDEDEFANNNWGSWQSARLGAETPQLAAGTYRIRVQYEGGGGENRMVLVWDDPSGGTGMFGVKGVFRTPDECRHVTVPMSCGDALKITPCDMPGPQLLLAPAFEVLGPAGSLLTRCNDGHRFTTVAPETGDYVVYLSTAHAVATFAGEYESPIIVQSFSGQEEVEPNDGVENATALDPPGDFRGDVASAADADCFSFETSPGQCVTVKLAGVPGRAPHVELLDPEGVHLSDDDSGLGLAVVVSAAGMHTLRVSGRQGEYVGSLVTADHARVDHETGDDFDSALALGPPCLHIVPAAFLSHDEGESPGLMGSYFNGTHFRAITSHDDWRETEMLGGSRIDRTVTFADNSLGERAEVGIEGGTDENWDGFGVQWDGWITVPAAGIRLYLRSDDASRLWIDLDNDGVFGAEAPECHSNDWGSEFRVKTSLPSDPMPAGTYRVRLQYEEGAGDNQMHLLWDFRRASGGIESNRTVFAFGRLDSLEDRDVFAVDLTAMQFFEIALASTDSGLPRQGRRLALTNSHGQMLEWSPTCVMHTNDNAGSFRPEHAGRHFVRVWADAEGGLGPYVLSVRHTGAFPEQRDVALAHHDYTGEASGATSFDRPDLAPLISGVFEAFFGRYGTKIVLDTPEEGSEHLRMGVGGFDFNGGVGGGSWGTRRPTGWGHINWSGKGVTSFCDSGLRWALSVENHEVGHGVGLHHARHPFAVMAYGDVLPQIADSSYFTFSWNSKYVPGTEVVRERDYLDLIFQPGRNVPEQEDNDALASAQPLTPLLEEMRQDADPHNDRVTVFGAIESTADIDCYRVRVADGEMLRVDIDSAEFHEPLDAQLELLSPDGQVLASNNDARDPDSGLTSLDPYLVSPSGLSGDLFVRVSPNAGTVGNYRLKVTPEYALAGPAPRVLAMWPCPSARVDGTRQLLFWTNRLLDPLSLRQDTIHVEGDATGPRPGFASFDPFDCTLVWRADEQLPPDSYTITLSSGAGGVTDCYGVPLDGETDGCFEFPEVSGDGAPGGDFVSSLTVSEPDTTPAVVSSHSYSRYAYSCGRFLLDFDDELDVHSLWGATIRLRSSGADGVLKTPDDTFPTAIWAYNKMDSTSSPALNVFAVGVPDAGVIRVEGTVEDAAGHVLSFDPAVPALRVVPSAALRLSRDGPEGLAGSYIDESLRGRPDCDDWRLTQDVAGSRADHCVDFRRSSWGKRVDVGLTQGTESDWEQFSVQWDGFVEIPTDGVQLFTRSDDGSRMWVDVDRDGVFLNDASELFDNHWGSGQGLHVGAGSPPLVSGAYRIRLQYEEQVLGNVMQLLWSAGHGNVHQRGGSRSRDWPTFAVADVSDARPFPGGSTVTVAGQDVQIDPPFLGRESAGRSEGTSRSGGTAESMSEGTSYIHGPVVVRLNVETNTVHPVAPSHVTVSFSGELDPDTLTTANLRLRFSPDPTFFDGSDSLVLDQDGEIAWNPARFEATLEPELPLRNGYYLLELNGEPGGISGADGRLLDGEYLDVLIPGNTDPFLRRWGPSGDGIPGGDYRAFFMVRQAAPSLPTVFTLRLEQQSGPALKLGLTTGATDGFDPLLDIVAHATESAPCAYLLLPSGVHEREQRVRVDFRPRTDTTRWRLVVTVNGTRRPERLSWDVPDAIGDKLLVLQELAADETPVGMPVDMAATDSLKVREDSVFEITYAPAMSLRVPVNEGWSLVGLPVMTTQTTGSLFGRDERVTEGSFWAYGDGVYRQVDRGSCLNPEHGYWVFGADTRELGPVQGVLADGLRLVHAGWSLISPVAPCPRPGTADIVSVWRWAADEQTYVMITRDQGLEPGHGYWVFSRSDGVWLSMGAAE